MDDSSGDWTVTRPASLRAKILARVPWSLVTAAAAGLFVGVRHGAEYALKSVAPVYGVQYVSPELVTLLTSGGLILGGALLALILGAFESSKPLGAWTWPATGFAALGIVIGLAAGPR